VEKTAAEPVPLHIRNAVTNLMKQVGYGKGYQYAHDLEEKVADMECMPDNLRGARVLPSNAGRQRKTAGAADAGNQTEKRRAADYRNKETKTVETQRKRSRRVNLVP